MILMSMVLSQAGATSPGTLVRTVCASGEERASKLFCTCMRADDYTPVWIPSGSPPAFTGTCFDVNARMMEVPELPELRAHFEARARRMACAHGYTWTPTGLVSQKCVKLTPNLAEILAGGAGTSIVFDDDLRMTTLADLGTPLAPYAYVGKFDGGQLEDDYLIVSDDGLDLWIAYGPFVDPEVILYPIPQE